MKRWEIESALRAEGKNVICGVDEAGRGPLAGPVCAAAVILPFGLEIEGLDDSKKLTSKKRDKLYDEIYAKGMTNSEAAERIYKKGYSDKMIVCDSAEPKSINDLRQYGLRVRGAKKGHDSISYGIKFLQSLEKIVIDRERSPNAAREFSEYELDRDKDGEFKSAYPDRDNHTIDAVRYALEDDISCRRARIIKRKDLNL